MAKYKIMIGGQKYKISLSDVTDYTIKDNNPTKDIIKYRVEIDENNPWEGTIYAHIENPSQHTLYLIENERCYITINCRNFIGHSASGCHCYQQWDPDDPRKINPNWWNMAHSSGLGRGSYRFHKHWSLCLSYNSLLNTSNNIPVKVADYENIEIPIKFQLASEGGYWHFANIKGFMFLDMYSGRYENPYRDSFYFDVRLALLTSCQHPTEWINVSRCRAYQTRSKITRITFER